MKSTVTIEDRVRDIMRDPTLETVLDGDTADHRPGRGYYVLRALMEILTENSSRRHAADTLVLSAVRVAGEAINRDVRARRAGK